MLRFRPRGLPRQTRGRVDRYSLLVRIFHPLLSAGLSRRTRPSFLTSFFCRCALPPRRFRLPNVGEFVPRFPRRSEHSSYLRRTLARRHRLSKAYTSRLTHRPVVLSRDFLPLFLPPRKDFAEWALRFWSRCLPPVEPWCRLASAEQKMSVVYSYLYVCSRAYSDELPVSPIIFAGGLKHWPHFLVKGDSLCGYAIVRRHDYGTNRIVNVGS